MKLIHLGTLSDKFNFAFFPKDPIDISTNAILPEFAKLLKVNSFSKKAKITSVKEWEEAFVNIEEKKTTATIVKCEKYDKELQRQEENIILSQIYLDDVKHLPHHDDAYILPNTIETHDCDVEMVCPTCNGSGECPDCHGERYVECDACHGTKVCSACDGTGNYPCSWCEGTGICDECDGDGEIYHEEECEACDGTGKYTLRNGKEVECRECGGSGKDEWTEDCDKCGGSGRCAKCGGEGYVECKACHGSGKCGKCKGEGKLRCETCHASGKCPRCSGKGVVRCTRCHGTGFYQTFDAIQLYEEVTNLSFINKDSEVIDASEAARITRYIGTPYTIEFSKAKIKDRQMFETLSKHNGQIHKTKLLDYKSKYISKDNSEALTDENVCITSNFIIESLSVLKLKITYSDKNFTFYVVGSNHDVYCDKKPSLWNRICAWF